MGVFDQNSLKFNDAIPNPSKEDGIDIVKCDNIDCIYRDNRGYCLYETCIVELLSSGIKYHNSFKHNCEICGNEYTNEYIGILPHASIKDFMCSECIRSLKNTICPEF